MATVTIPNRPAGTDQRSIEQILANFDAVTAQVNGNLDSTNIANSLAKSAGVNTGTQKVKGSILNAGPGNTNSAAPAAPSDAADKVSGLVLDSPGIIEVWFYGTWSESVSNTARAAIFVNGTQMQLTAWASGAAAAITGAQQARTGQSQTVSKFGVLHSFPGGLAAHQIGTSDFSYPPSGTPLAIANLLYNHGDSWIEVGGVGFPVQLSEILGGSGGEAPEVRGGCCPIGHLNAGTYDIEVKYWQTLGGQVNVGTRTLLARALSFS